MDSPTPSSTTVATLPSVLQGCPPLPWVNQHHVQLFADRLRDWSLPFRLLCFMPLCLFFIVPCVCEFPINGPSVAGVTKNDSSNR